MRERSGNACVLSQHVQCGAERRWDGAPSPQARPIPRAFSARAPALRAGAVRTRRRCAPAAGGLARVCDGLLIREGLGHNADGRPLVMTPELLMR